MYARKRLSNTSAVLENITPEDRATEVDLDKHLPSADSWTVVACQRRCLCNQ